VGARAGASIIERRVGHAPANAAAGASAASAASAAADADAAHGADAEADAGTDAAARDASAAGGASAADAVTRSKPKRLNLWAHYRHAASSIRRGRRGWRGKVQAAVII
jgi:hypothetical protein